MPEDLTKKPNQVTPMTNMPLVWLITTAGHLITHPLSTITNRYQVATNKVKSIHELNHTIFQNSYNDSLFNKIKNLYQGFTASGLHKLCSRIFKFCIQPFYAQQLNDHYSNQFIQLFGEKHANSFIQAFAGALVGISEIPLLYPIDTLKVMRQSGDQKPIFSLLQNQKHKMYKGASLAISKNILGLSTFFGITEAVKTYVEHDEKNQIGLKSTLSAAMIGAFADTALTYPMDLIKKRTQMQKGSLSSYEMAKKTIQEEGITGLYRGCFFKILRSAPKKALPFAVMQYLTQKID